MYNNIVILNNFNNHVNEILMVLIFLKVSSYLNFTQFKNTNLED